MPIYMCKRAAKYDRACLWNSNQNISKSLQPCAIARRSIDWNFNPGSGHLTVQTQYKTGLSGTLGKREVTAFFELGKSYSLASGL